MMPPEQATPHHTAPTADDDPPPDRGTTHNSPRPCCALVLTSMVSFSTMFRLFALSLLLASGNSSSASSLSTTTTSRSVTDAQQQQQQDTTRRSLEDANNNNNNAFYGYTMKAGTCIRLKVQQDNDDDGNSYFYNGAYRAQFERYASFSLCPSGSNDDTTVDEDCQDEYVMDLESYLETMSEYVEYYCEACSYDCRRRRVEDVQEEEGQDEDSEEEEEKNWQVNCSTCSSECSLMKNNGGYSEESAYLGCSWAYQDGDIDYYSGPSCDNGNFAIGFYYDDECMIKSRNDDDLAYNNFQTIQQMTVDCSSGPCQDLYDEAYSCNGDNSKLCKSAANARKERSFYKKPWYKKLEVPGILIFVSMIGGAVAFFSYTYYVRHSRPKTPLATLDGTNLPELT